MSNPHPGKILIIGAGPTGLGAAWRLEELGYNDYLVVEAKDHPGGLSSSVTDESCFIWDLGGHVQFSHYSYYDKVVDRAVNDWLWHDRESWIWFRDRFVPYPFQYNLHRLNEEDRRAALEGLRLVSANLSEVCSHANFHEWIMHTFGEGLAELFLTPYNEKVWAHPLEQMDWNWIGERVAVPDLKRVEENISRNQDDVSWGPNNRFRFPLHGGTGAICNGIAGLLPTEKLRYGVKVGRIDSDGKTAYTDSGEALEYDMLINTMPLDLLIGAIDNPSNVLAGAKPELKYSSTHVFGIGMRGEIPAELKTKCWMYFPCDNSPYYRVTVFSNYSPHNVPGSDMWSLLVELSESQYRKVDPESIKDWVLRALMDDKLITSDSCIETVWHKRLEHGYPTPFLGRDRLLAPLHAELESAKIFSRGRFGGWKYEVANQDHSFMQGVELSEYLLTGKPESTYPEPECANSGKFMNAK